MRTIGTSFNYAIKYAKYAKPFNGKPDINLTNTTLMGPYMGQLGHKRLAGIRHEPVIPISKS